MAEQRLDGAEIAPCLLPKKITTSAARYSRGRFPQSAGPSARNQELTGGVKRLLQRFVLGGSPIARSVGLKWVVSRVIAASANKSDRLPQGDYPLR
jgi:hypothetical protein